MSVSPEYLQEIEALYLTLEGLDHYSVLGVDRLADRPTILNAHQTRARRFRPLPGPLPPEHRARVDAILRALDEGVGVLADPTRRFAYDQSLPPLRRPSSKPPARLSNGAVPQLPDKDAGLLQAVMHSLLTGPNADPTTGGHGPPRPITQPPPRPVPQGTTAAPTPAPTEETPGASPTGSARDRRVRTLEHQVEGLSQELLGLYEELEKVTAALQLCVAELSREDSLRVEQFQGAAQVLLGTRAELALRLALREAEEGRWEHAQVLWHKALRPRGDAATHIQIADALWRNDGDLALAAEHARKAVALSPDLPAAQACLAIVAARRDAT
jgi:curved DNA-binding protein CbpA